MKNQYQKTIAACFAGCIVQAIVNNFAPLLFLFFQKSYQIPLAQITLLVTFNFGIQLLTDVLSIGVIEKVGYRSAIVGAHVLSAAGLVLLTILPKSDWENYTGETVGELERGEIALVCWKCWSVPLWKPAPLTVRRRP